MNLNKTTALLFFAGILLFVFLIIIFLILKPKSEKINTTTIRPTPVVVGKQSNGSYRTSRLEKTEIGITTDRQVEESFEVVDKKTIDSTTVYTINSSVPGYTDEIWIQNGVVVYESTNTETLQDNGPPKISIIIDDLGQPEDVIRQVGRGWYTSLYLYPKKGMAFLANPNTGSVYEVYKFIPLDLDQFLLRYPDLVEPGPSPPLEGP